MPWGVAAGSVGVTTSDGDLWFDRWFVWWVTPSSS
jgi:hypothetical protein